MLVDTLDQVENNPAMYATWLNGMVFVDKTDPQYRKNAVEKMARVLENGYSVIVYPEGVWNNIENLLVQRCLQAHGCWRSEPAMKLFQRQCIRTIMVGIFGAVLAGRWIWHRWRKKMLWTSGVTV